MGFNTDHGGKKSAIFSENQLLAEPFQLLAKSLQQIQFKPIVPFFFMLTTQYSLLLISKFLSLCCHFFQFGISLLTDQKIVLLN